MHIRFWLQRTVAALAIALLPCGASGQGVTVAIGGALQDGNAAVWSRLVSLAGGRGACFSVLATASAQPDASAAAVAANLQRHGARGQHIRVAPGIAGLDVAQAVRDPALAAKVSGCRGVFFTGGAQERLLDALQPGGRSTPLLDAVRAVWQRGGVVAGTSSGAAVLSAVAFRDAPDPLAVLQGQLREGREWDHGFGFAPPGVVIDQHFVRRGRIGRLLPLLQAQGLALGLGVEEDSAAVISAGMVEVIGTRGVLVADLTGATRDSALPAFNLQGAVLHWLASGDRFDLATRRVQPSAAKQAGTLLQPTVARRQGQPAGDLVFADMLGSGVIVQAMLQLLDGDLAELRGLSLNLRPAAADPNANVGFEWHLWSDSATTGWLGAGAAEPTLSGVRLDIVPVRVQRPLYEPIQATPSPRTTPP